MGDKSTVLKTFNIQFFSFIDDVIKVFPDRDELIVGKRSFETIKRANPTIIIKIWFSHVYNNYRESIDNGDVEYFIQKDYQQDLKSLANNGEVLKIINTLRQPISEMDEVNKKHTVKYLQVLSKLSEMYSKL
jgi:hypothetical protein|tara:strand:- start:13388 stop:13783 length:396 start_codon:yes stop_codon:yes gene_type:complete